MITDYFMITEKSNRLQVIMITDYDYPISAINQVKPINIVHSVTKNVLNMVNSASSADPSCSVFCLFALLLYVPVNSYGHYGMVSSSDHTFSWVNLIKRLTSICAHTKNSLVTTAHLE